MKCVVCGCIREEHERLEKIETAGEQVALENIAAAEAMKRALRFLATHEEGGAVTVLKAAIAQSERIDDPQES